MTGHTDRSDLARFFLDHVRQMGRMALHAINLGHIGDMRTVALLTIHQ